MKNNVLLRIAAVLLVSAVDGKWVPGRRLNGDENRVGINGVGVRVVLYPSAVTVQGR